MSARTRNKPIKTDDELAIKLYGPTTTNPKYRLDYVDPLTGQRCQPRRTDKAEAFALWDETIAYLDAARHAAPAPARSTSSKRRAAPTVDDLFDARMERWHDDGCTDGYIRTRSGRYDHRLRPVFGHSTVREWAASSEGCREVLRAARVQGLSKSSIQDLGALMRSLVTLGWEKRWISPGHNPMQGVRYTKGSTEQGQAVEFVREEDRPEFAAVERLYDAYEDLVKTTGIFWLPTRARVAGQGGLRPSEQDALRLCDLRPDDLEVVVDGAFTVPRGGDGPVRKDPKNGKRRRVLLPASTIDRLVDVRDRRLADGAADDALLFEDPTRPGLPISESATRRLHIDAANSAGWETVEVRRVDGPHRHRGADLRPRHTNYTLRHHAAVWMHDVAGYDWTDVSEALGHHSVAFTYAVYVRSGSDARQRNRERLREM